MICAFHPAAELELLEQVGFYESKVPGLGRLLIEEVERLIALICASPQAWVVAGAPEVRRAPLQRFPLSLLYRVTAAGVQVLALAHHKRRPLYWLGRI